MNLLLGIGGSPDSLQALEKTVARCRETGDDLTVAIVENETAELSVEQLRHRVRETLDGADFPAEVVVLEGHAGSQLVEYAEQEGFDRIVLGGGETSPLGKVQLGSIAEFVLLNAQTSVTLVR